MLKPFPNFYKDTRFKHYIVIFLLLLLQFGGISNMKRLGFITDDWVAFRYMSYNVKRSFWDILNFKLDTNDLGHKVARPLPLLFAPLHLIMYGDNPLMNHLGMFASILVCMMLLYEAVFLITGRRNTALMVSVIFIALPFHTSNYYWLATRVTIHTFILALVSLLCLYSNKRLIRNIIGPLSLFLSISSYEIFLSFIPLYFYIIFFTRKFEKNNLKSKLLLMSYNLSSVLLLLIYRKIFLVDMLKLEMPKEVSIGSTSFIIDKFSTMISNLLGKGLFDFFNLSIKNLYLIHRLENWVLLVFALLIILIFFVCTSLLSNQVDSQSSIKEPNILFNSGIILTSFGLVSLIPTGYFYRLGSPGDRVNLVICLGISFIISSLINLFSLKKTKYLVILLLSFFTLINWTYLVSYIKSYEYQTAFIKYVKNIEIPENSLVFLNTDLDYFNNTPVLTTRWGVTGILSYASGRARVEHVGDWEDVKSLEHVSNYQSKQYKDYVYINPTTVFISFNKTNVN